GRRRHPAARAGRQRPALRARRCRERHDPAGGHRGDPRLTRNRRQSGAGPAKAGAMRTLDMATFVTLARTRHFGRAARELNATQPAVSSRLAALEEELGCRLVERGAGEFRLTPEGERTLAVFQSVLTSLGSLRESLRSPHPVAPPLLRIGAIDSIACTWMPQLIEQLRERLPNLKIELAVEGTKVLVAGLGKGVFDIIFAVDPAVGDGLGGFVS